jgi:hypothetical protein
MSKLKNSTNRKPYSQKETEFYKKLTRLFSGPIANYQRQFPYKPKKSDLYKYNFKDLSTGPIKRSSNQLRLLLSNRAASAEVNRIDRYIDYNQMEYDPYMATALDIYANEITTHSTIDPLLIVESDNDHIKDLLTDLFYNVLNIEYNLRPWVRETCKFGDSYLWLQTEEGKGIQAAIQIPQEQIERLEGVDQDNPNYVQFQWNEGGITFENHEICHFRIPGNGRFYPYGTSVLESARRTWRQLELMINHMIAYRVIRSGEKRVFKLQVGHIKPDDVEQEIEKTMTRMKRTEIVDPDATSVDRRYSPWGVEEDIIIPVRGDLGSSVETLSSNSSATSTEDIQFLREALFAAIKIPQTYLARSAEGGGEDQTSLAQKNITFANVIGVIQMHIISELNKMATVHLYSLGFRGKDLLKFKIKLCNSSKLAETQELNNLKMKVEIAQAVEKVTNRRWVAEKIMGFTGEEYRRILLEKYSDAKFDAMLATIGKNAEEGMPGMGDDMMGMGGEEFGGSLGEMQPPPMEDSGMDMGMDGGMDMGTPEPSGGKQEEDVMLAAPGYRLNMMDKKTAKLRGDEYITPGSKGKGYTAKGVSSTRGIKQSQRAKADGTKYLDREAGIIKENREEILLEEINDIIEKYR